MLADYRLVPFMRRQESLKMPIKQKKSIICKSVLLQIIDA